MSDPYIGEIRMFGGNFAPSGWLLCDGRSLSISQYDTLYNLIGTTYGGDGVNTFNLPDLRGRAPIHVSPQYPLAAMGGSETVSLTTAQMGMHTHTAYANTGDGSLNVPTGNVWAKSVASFSGSSPDTAMAPTDPAGSGQPHENMMPVVVVNYIISLAGIYPQQG